MSDYAAQVKAQVLVHKAYPNLAERLGHEGTVKVGFTVKEDGSLEGVTVKVPSGFAELDQAAVDAVLQAEPFAPFPLGLNETGLALTLTLHFRLE